MRVAITLSLLLTMIVAASAQFAPCVIYANCPWASNAPVCGRFGRSNLCRNFRNFCYMQAANCGQLSTYTTIALTNCAGIALNQRATCKGVSSTTGNTNDILSGLLGQGGFGSNIQPIILPTG